MIGTVNYMVTAEWMIGAVLAVAVWLVREKVKFVDKKLETLSADQNEIKLNYLDRFERLNTAVNDGHISIITAIGELKVELAKGYMAKIDCPLMHKVADADQS
jgi:hypothetical protein